jgi:hypothetical protein
VLPGGVGRDPEDSADLLVGEPRRDRLESLELSGGEAIAGRRGFVAKTAPRQAGPIRAYGPGTNAYSRAFLALT